MPAAKNNEGHDRWEDGKSQSMIEVCGAAYVYLDPT